jgi:hypothetical protein
MATIVIENILIGTAGAVSCYSATIGSLTHIAGVQHSSFGRYRVKTANGDAGRVSRG